MPRSSDPVATMARSAPAAIAASTLARTSRLSEPWCSPIASPSSFCAHRCWKNTSACARVLMKTSVVPAPRISSITAGAA